MNAYTSQSSFRLLMRVLNRKERIRFSLFIPLTLIGTTLELVSLGLVIPVVQVILGGNKLETYGFLPDAVEDLRYQTFVVLLLSILVSAFLLKNLFILGSNYYQHRAQLALGNRITQRMFENYMRQPYEFHLMHSPARLGTNIGEYSGAVLYFLGAVLLLFADVLTGLGFLVVLMIVQPVSTLTVGFVFGGSAWLVLRLTRSRAREWGQQRIAYRAAIGAAILSGFSGVKEIKLFGRDREVVETHKKSVYGETRTVYLFNVISNVPRALFEVLAVASVAITVVVSKLRDANSTDATLIVALFGVAAFRMLPSINRIVVSLQQFSLSRPGLEGAIESLSLESKAESVQPDDSIKMFERLEVLNLQYRYPSSEKTIVEIGKLTINSGDSIGVVGSSGSGKSTLVDLLIGILPATEGQVLINGKDVSTCRRDWQNLIGYVPQATYLMDTTIRRNVAFGIADKLIDNAQVEHCLKTARLWDFIESLPMGWDTEVGERAIRLSGGQRQRLGIARALYANPQVIVLDEATSALDDATEREIVESFREIALDRTLIIVAHRTSTLRDCNRVIRLEGGQIVQEGSFYEVVGSLPETFDRGQ